MLIELLRPAGPALARRWLAALLLAPESDREAIVESVEQRMATLYAERQPSLGVRRAGKRAKRRAG